MPETKLAPWDKILPNQSFNSNLFRGPHSFEQAVYDVILKSCAVKPPQQQFKLETSNLFTVEEMASSPVTLGFLQWLIRMAGMRRVLEIGGFIGVSTMYFAQALPAGGVVVSVEKFEQFADIARRNFAANGLTDKIRLVCGDAGEVVPTLDPAEPFDLVFIDGNKERYAFYLRSVMPLVRAGGIVAVDDAFFHGDALNPQPSTEKGQGVRACLDLVESLSSWDRVLLPVCNGLMLLTKRGG